MMNNVLPFKHVELRYLARKALSCIKSSTKRVLFLTKYKETISIQYWVQYCGELFGEPQLALGEDLNLGILCVLIQPCQHYAVVKPSEIML